MMTRQDIEALLRLLAEWEREELELSMQERQRRYRRGGCTRTTASVGSLVTSNCGFTDEGFQVIHAFPLGLSIFPWCHRARIPPETEPLSPGLTLRIGILITVRGGLFTLIFLVVPRHAGFDLIQIGVLTIHDHFAE